MGSFPVRNTNAHLAYLDVAPAALAAQRRVGQRPLAAGAGGPGEPDAAPVLGQALGRAERAGKHVPRPYAPPKGQ